MLPLSSAFERAVWAVRAQFFLAGALFATWGVHVPTVKRHYGLGEQSLSLAMLAAGIGAVAALTQAGRVVGRFGSRATAVGAGLLTAVSLACLLLGGHWLALGLVMVLFGMGNGLFDVSINAAASDLEREGGRSRMSGFHGMFSLGGMAGAAFGSAWLGLGLPAAGHLVGTTLVAGLLVAVAGRWMPRQAPTDESAPAEPLPRFALPRGVLALLGTLAALGLIAEGSMYDWSVLYMAQELRSEPGTAALAYAAFSGAMAATRFGGDWLRDRIAPATLMSASAALAAVSMAVVLLVAHPVVALIGFALVGVGFANIVPALFSAAAQAGLTPAHGIAVVASMGYLGMMAGPPLIGLVGEHSSLTWGLATVVLFAGVLALAAPKAMKR